MSRHGLELQGGKNCGKRLTYIKIKRVRRFSRKERRVEKLGGGEVDAQDGGEK